MATAATDQRLLSRWRNLMQWWGWVIVALVVVAVLVVAVLAVQARRRRGGVIIDGAGPGGPRTGGRP